MLFCGLLEKYFLLHGNPQGFPSRQGAIKTISLCTSLALTYLPAELIKHFTEVEQHDLPQMQTQPASPQLNGAI